MKQLLILAFAVSAATSLADGTARLDGSLWYGGDPNGVDGLSSERNTVVSDALTVDDFDLHSASMITRVYGVFFSDMTAPRGFDVQIRTGVSSGNGGTLVYGANELAGTWERFAKFDNFGFSAYRAVIDIEHQNLAAGTYWLGIRVVGNGSGRAFIATTSGANSIGSPVGNGNSFFDSSFFGISWASTSDLLGERSDFAYGVVPEPATMLALAGAFGALAARRRRK